MRFLTVLAVVFLAGCSTFSKSAVAPVCPRTGLVADAATVTFLSDDGTPVVEGVIDGFKGSCRLSRDGFRTAVELHLPIAVKREATAGDLAQQELPYFISVLSSQDDILQHHRFTTTIPFGENGIGFKVEEHIIHIYFSTGETADSYKIAAGFALTPEQLQYNREEK